MSAALRGVTVTPVALLTVTVTDREVEPPGPVQLRVKMVVAASAPVEAPLLLVGFDPLQPALAVQALALVVLQISMAALPAVTTVGLAVSVMVGAGAETVTVNDAEPVPPGPLQANVKDDVLFNAGTSSVPLVSLAPLHAPEAVHAVALVVLQLRVVEPPEATVAGVALKVTVGRGAAMLTVTFAAAEPPAPVQLNE